MADDVLPADEVAEPVDQLRQLLADATPGPWELTVDERSWEDQTGERYAQIDWELVPPGTGMEWVLSGMDDRGEFDQVRADVKLITAARNALPDLLAEVETLRATVARLERERESLARRCAVRSEETQAALDVVELLRAGRKPDLDAGRWWRNDLRVSWPMTDAHRAALRAALDATTAPEPARTPLWTGRTRHGVDGMGLRTHRLRHRPRRTRPATGHGPMAGSPLPPAQRRADEPARPPGGDVTGPYFRHATGDTAWMRRGACATAGVDMFPTDTAGFTAARTVCERCPVRERCLDYALANRIDDGCWGGVSERGRRRMLKERRGAA